ncbi:MAG: DUF4403 family protein [Bacteroidota bacterium]
MWRYLVLLLIFGVVACKSSQKAKTSNEETPEYLDEIVMEEIEKPEESYNYVEEVIENSVLNIPVNLPIRQLEDLLNEEIKKALEANNTFEQDDLKIEASQLNPVEIGLEEQRILYKVPLGLKIEKDLGFSRVKADASLVLDFFTDFDIDEFWNLTTETALEQYEWIEAPSLKLGPVRVPAQFVGDIVVRRSRELVTDAIDEQLKSNFDLRQTMSNAWKELQTPIEISRDYKTWLSIHPKQILVTPISSKEDAISLTISILAQPNLEIGERPQLNASALPAFSFQEVKEEDFQIRLMADIPYEEAEALAVQSIKGEQYSSEKYSVTVEDISLYGQDEKLVVETLLSGSYDGNVYLTGEPFYNKLRNKVDIKDLKFTLNTKSFLLKSAAWLLKSNLRKQIRENVNFYVDYNLSEIRKTTQQQLERYEIASGVVLKGNLDDLNITDVYLTPKGIRVKLGLSGQVNVGMEILEEVLEK